MRSKKAIREELGHNFNRHATKALYDMMILSALGDAEKLKEVIARVQSSDNKKEFGNADISVNTDDSFGDTAMHKAAYSGNVAVAKLLKEVGAQVDPMNIELQTPLHQTSLKDNHEVASFLIKSGADVDAIDLDHETPLHQAFYMGAVKTAAVLLEAGADYSIKSVYSLSAEDVAFMNGHGDMIADARKARAAKVLKVMSPKA